MEAFNCFEENDKEQLGGRQGNTHTVVWSNVVTLQTLLHYSRNVTVFSLHKRTRPVKRHKSVPKKAANPVASLHVDAATACFQTVLGVHSTHSAFLHLLPPASSYHATWLARLPPAAGTKKSPHSWPWLLLAKHAMQYGAYLPDSDGCSESPRRPELCFPIFFIFYFLRCPEQADLVACLKEMLSVCTALFEAVALSSLSLAVKIQLQPSTVKWRMNAPCLYFKPRNVADGQWRGKESWLHSLIT